MFIVESNSQQYKTEGKYDSATGAKVHYCEDCQSVLYPKTTQNGTVLEYFCPQCKKSQEVDDKLVYVNVLVKSSVGGIKATNLADDPTLPIVTCPCEVCGTETEHVIFMAPALKGEERMEQLKECKICHRTSSTIKSE